MKKYDSSKVLEFFNKITQIPRGSGREKQISDYLVNFAKERNLYVKQDEALNVFIVKEATKGYEEYEPLILQAHMDMVWEKNKDVNFDFETEGINIYEEDGFLKAKGTTLGADDGAGVSIILAILDNNEISHPKLEIILTTDEEVGMSGAEKFDISQLTGKRMINIDTEEDDKIYVSSAGGSRAVSTLKLDTEKIDIADKIFKLEISGLKGGHSGIDIDKKTGNSNKVLVEFLKHIMIKYEISIVNIDGGDKENAIPREAEVIFTTPDAEYMYLNEELKMICQIMNYGLEGQVQFKLTEIENSLTNRKEKITHIETVRLIKFLIHFPHGVQSYSPVIEGFVQTSINMGVIRTRKENKYIYVDTISLIRSSDNKELEEMKMDVELLTKKFDGTVFKDSSYGAWEYREDSQIRKIFEKAFKEYTGEDVPLSSIHAGLECGLFIEKNKDFDIISMGPNIYGAHTPDERMEIKSVEKIYNILVIGLKNYAIR